MKKKMLDENMQKISQLADRSINDTSTANILICYVLYRVDEPIHSDLLYDIAVTSGIINYFTFSDSLSSLKESNAVKIITNDKGEELYLLTEHGVESAKLLKSLAGKSYRDDLVLAAKRAMRRFRHRKEVQLTYEPTDQGCYLKVKLFDHELTLLELRLFTPSEEQAVLLGDKIMANPLSLYNSVLNSVVRTEEEPIDLTDN